MSVALLKCGKCQKEYRVENELFADTCGHHKCRECILSAGDTSCDQCVVASTDAAQANSINKKIPQKTKKESKVSTQTHIVDELSATGNIQYHCTACGKIFRSRSQKYYHLQCNQPNDVLYECDVCKKGFGRYSQFKYHSESHASPVNECAKCQKNFSNPLALKKHEGLHKVEPKQCPHCEKTFLKRISLEQHVAARHLHQLHYGCTFCNKKYASKSTLQQHLQSHEQKRFECSYCGKNFQRNSILNLHLKRHYHHTDTFKCKMCDKVFNESGALARHRKIHEENALQYHCKLCDKNILRKDNMTRHVNTIHPEEKFDDIVLIIRPLDENEKGQSSEIPEERQPIGVSRSLDAAEQAKLRDSYNKSVGTENITFVKDYANVHERKESKPQNNFVIIENRVLQKPKEIQVLESAFKDDKFFRTDDLCKVNPTRICDKDYIKIDLSAPNSKPPIVTQVHVITPLSNIDEKNIDVLPQSEGNFTKSVISNVTPYAGKKDENRIEYNSSLFLNLDQSISFSNLLTKSAFENNILNVLNPNKHSNSLGYKNKNVKPLIANTESQNVSNGFKSSHSNLPPTSSNFCGTIDQTTHNKASVIRSVGNVRKMLTSVPTTTTITKYVVPNNDKLDCEYKHKKYSRHYNVDLYRKILGCEDDDDDESEEDQHRCNHQSGKLDNSCDAANAAPVHWRKSFKNSYETSTL